MLTDAEINKAIAEWCGYYVIQDDSGSGYKLIHPTLDVRYAWCDSQEEAWSNTPDYHRDFNACHEAEKEILKNEPEMGRNTYGFILRGLVGEHYYHATARQRCEALLRVLGKRKEDSNAQ